MNDTKKKVPQILELSPEQLAKVSGGDGWPVPPIIKLPIVDMIASRCPPMPGITLGGLLGKK
jgi:hypothetical protein